MMLQTPISQVFGEFLSDQEARLSPKTLSKYEGIVSLFKSYLESYWPGHDQEEYNRITGQGGTFCGVVVKTSRGWRLREVWNVSP